MTGMLLRTASLALLTIGLFVSGPTPARAERTDAAACYVISDADARAYCLARAREEAGTCYTIQRPDLRSQCLAEIRRK